MVFNENYPVTLNPLRAIRCLFVFYQCRNFSFNVFINFILSSDNLNI